MMAANDPAPAAATSVPTVSGQDTRPTPASFASAQSPTSGPATGTMPLRPAAPPSNSTPPTSITDTGNTLGATQAGGERVGSISMPINVTVNVQGQSGPADANEIARIARLEVRREAERQMGSLRRYLHD
jgi:hypothetical protein